MKRLTMASPKMPRTARTGVARTRKDAAIQLVRLEFDMSRLERSIEQADRRSASDRQSFHEKERQRRSLMKILNR